MKNVDEILALSPAEKILLIEKIWDSLPDNSIEISEAQKGEVRNRIKRFKEGKSKFYTWDEVKREIRLL
jgi:putative addiction module component (TIGR02574 family)